ncbi:MAG: hypothetical protein H6553_13895 [Chitinophagales bacterium]|nr:hypothetical protein [Chitinophagales bacterium]
MKFLKENILDVVAVLVLLLIGIKWAVGLKTAMEIVYGDEVEYLRNGVDLFHTIRNNWGPSYNLWYKFLSLFQHDVIDLYYLNFQITGILTAILFYIFLRINKIHILVSFLLSAFFFMSMLNASNWPRVSHFVVIVFFTATIIAAFFKSNTNKSIVLTSAFLIIAFARPEYFIAVFLSTFITIYCWIKEKASFHSTWKSLVGFTLIAILLFGIFGLPSGKWKGEDRKFSAFRQHYAINLKQKTKANFDPVTEWMPITEKEFEGCKSFTEVLIKYPNKVIKNTLQNIKTTALSLIIVSGDFLFPNVVLNKNKLKILIISLFIFVFVVSFYSKTYRHQFWHYINNNLNFVFALLLALPSVMIALMLFPRMHYLYLQTPLLILLMAISISIFIKKIPFKNIIFLFFALFILILSPKANDYVYFQIDSDMKNFCQQKTMRLLMQDKTQKHVVFSNYLNVSYLLPKNYSEFNIEYDYKKGMQFINIVDSLNIDMILMNDYITNNKLLQQDTTWLNFIANPSAFGFHKKTISTDCNSYILQK